MSFNVKKTYLSFVFSLAILLLLVFSCRKEYSCESCKNKAPVANAGPDLIINLPRDSCTLDGSKSYDPDGTIILWEWKKISGPVILNIAKPSNPITLVTGMVAGRYSFELKITDNDGSTTKDTVVVSVIDTNVPNHPPIANAGANQTITLPLNSAILDGSHSTDPDNNIVSYIWTKISGPTSISFSSQNEISISITNLSQGTYSFELIVSDAGGLMDKDTTTVVVIPPLQLCDTNTRAVINAQLVPLGNITRPRSGMAVAAAGNKIVFAGGWETNGAGYFYSGAVDIYDISTQSWFAASLGDGRCNIAAIANGNKIFFGGGGYIYSDYFDNVDIYDVSNNSWSRTNLSTPRTSLAAAAVGDKVMFAGGYETSTDLAPNNISDIIDIYNLTTNTWSQSYLSQKRGSLSAVTENNKVYFAGGYFNYSTGASNVIDIYDNNTNSWTVSVLNYVSGANAGIFLSDKIYWSDTDCPVEFRNINTGTSVAENKYGPLSNNSQIMLIKDNKVIILRTGDYKFDIYDPSSDTWSVGILPLFIPYDASIICVNNTIYIAGGRVDTYIMTDKLYKLIF